VARPDATTKRELWIYLGLRNAGRPRFKKLFFAVNQGVDVVGGQLDAVAMGDGVCGAGLDAVAAENAARIVDVVDLGVAFTGRNALGVRIFSGFDVDAIRGTCGGAQKAADTFFKSIFVALQNVNAAITCLNSRRSVRKTFRGGLAEHRPERNAEALDEGDKCFGSFLNNVCHREVTLTKLEQAGNGLICKEFGPDDRSAGG
jgi:hypothetical protein